MKTIKRVWPMYASAALLTVMAIFIGDPVYAGLSLVLYSIAFCYD